MTFRVHAEGGSAPAALHVTAGEPFPDGDWRDFPVIVLTWWLKGWRAVRESGAPVRNSFMNGPYAFDVAPGGDSETLTLRFVRRTPGDDAEAAPPATVRAEDYEAALLGAAEAVAAAVPSDDPDLPALRAAIDAVRS